MYLFSSIHTYIDFVKITLRQRNPMSVANQNYANIMKYFYRALELITSGINTGFISENFKLRFHCTQNIRAFKMKLAVCFTALLPSACFSYKTGSSQFVTGSTQGVSFVDNMRSLIQCVSMTLLSGNDPEIFCSQQVKI